MTDDCKLSTGELMRRARIAAGLSPDKRPATIPELTQARAAKHEAKPGSDEHNMREAKLAEIEDRQPRYVQGL